MSLTITDAGGNDLFVTPPQPITLVTGGKTAQVGIYAVITENDPQLLQPFVYATIDWNDGSQPVAYGPVPGSLVLNVARALGLGTYAVKISAHNNRQPTPDTVNATFTVVVTAPSSATPASLIFGPILPRDDGKPGPQDWIFNTGSDLAVLASSVKMLLITSKGERVMQPTYGTRLRRILFELNINAADAIVQQEINQALAANEPRVSLVTVQTVRGPGPRSVTVNATFQSKLSGVPFQLNLGISQ